MKYVERNSRMMGKAYYFITSDNHPAVEGERSQPEAVVEKDVADQAPDLDAFLRETFKRQTGLEA